MQALTRARTHMLLYTQAALCPLQYTRARDVQVHELPLPTSTPRLKEALGSSSNSSSTVTVSNGLLQDEGAAGLRSRHREVAPEEPFAW